MAHGKMDRSKQEREISDVTYGPHTQSIREGPKWCLCQSDGCMPLLLWKEWDATLHPGLVSPLLSTSAIKARHSSCLANKSLKSSWLLLVGADSFHAEAGFTCPHLGGYQLLLPNCVRNLHSSKPLVREMLPSTCSKHQGCCWLLYPVRHQGWAPAVAWSGRWWAKGRLALLGMLGNGEAMSPSQPSKMPTWLEAKVGTDVLSTEILLKQSNFFLAINGSFALWGLRDLFKFPLLHLAKTSILSVQNGILSN